MMTFHNVDEGQLKNFVVHASGLVVIMDEQGQLGPLYKMVLEMAAGAEIPVSTFVIRSDALDEVFFDDNPFVGILQSQPMGTRIAVVAGWNTIQCLDPLFEHLGVTEEEVMAIVIGEVLHPVFCAACYHLNQAHSGPDITCAACGRRLEVSNHYSKRHHAVMGHIVLQEQRKDKTDSL